MYAFDVDGGLEKAGRPQHRSRHLPLCIKCYGAVCYGNFGARFWTEPELSAFETLRTKAPAPDLAKGSPHWFV